jgi:hypothetical protein
VEELRCVQHKPIPYWAIDASYAEKSGERVDAAGQRVDRNAINAPNLDAFLKLYPAAEHTYVPHPCFVYNAPYDNLDAPTELPTTVASGLGDSNPTGDSNGFVTPQPLLANPAASIGPQVSDPISVPHQSTQQSYIPVPSDPSPLPTGVSQSIPASRQMHQQLCLPASAPRGPSALPVPVLQDVLLLPAAVMREALTYYQSVQQLHNPRPVHDPHPAQDPRLRHNPCHRERAIPKPRKYH